MIRCTWPWHNVSVLASCVGLLTDPAWFCSNVFSWSCTCSIASFHFNSLGNRKTLLLFPPRNHLTLKVLWDDAARSKFNWTQDGGEETRIPHEHLCVSTGCQVLFAPCFSPYPFAGRHYFLHFHSKITEPERFSNLAQCCTRFKVMS